MKMKSAREFEDECLREFVKVIQSFGYAENGPLVLPALEKKAGKSVVELMKYKGLIKLFGNDPYTYYYYINGLSFGMGVTLAMLYHNARERFDQRDIVRVIANDPETSAHDLAFHTLQQFGMIPDIYNQLVKKLYERYQELYSPYKAAKEPRDYAIAGFLASFLAGSSLVLGKCGYRSKEGE